MDFSYGENFLRFSLAAINGKNRFFWCCHVKNSSDGARAVFPATSRLNKTCLEKLLKRASARNRRGKAPRETIFNGVIRKRLLVCEERISIHKLLFSTCWIYTSTNTDSEKSSRCSVEHEHLNVKYLLKVRGRSRIFHI